jgi:hypothetical protein
VSGQVIDSMVSGASRDSLGEAVYSTGGEVEARRRSFMTVTSDAAMLANQHAGTGLSQEKVDTAVGIGLDSGHNNAKTDLSNYASDLDADGSDL